MPFHPPIPEPKGSRKVHRGWSAPSSRRKSWCRLPSSCPARPSSAGYLAIGSAADSSNVDRRAGVVFGGAAGLFYVVRLAIPVKERNPDKNNRTETEAPAAGLMNEPNDPQPTSHHPSLAGLTDAGLEALLRRAMRITLILGLLGALMVWKASGWRNAAMLATGTLISAASILEWRRLIRLINAKTGQTDRRPAAAPLVVALLSPPPAHLCRGHLW